MASLVNNTSRVIVVDGIILVPGKAQQVKDVKKLTAKYPQLSELIETGEIAEKEAVKATEVVKPAETEDESRTLNRRKRG